MQGFNISFACAVTAAEIALQCYLLTNGKDRNLNYNVQPPPPLSLLGADVTKMCIM